MSKHQTTTPSPKAKPKELDLNINDMRAKLQHELMTTMRDVMRKFDDLEALERLLHSEAVGELTRRVGRTHTNGNGNGNGNGGNGHHHDSDVELLERAAPMRRKQSPRSDREAVQAAALKLLETKPGASTIEIRHYLKEIGVISPRLTDQSADATVRYALSRAVENRLARAEQESRGPGAALRYYLPEAPPPSQVSKVGVAATTAVPAAFKDGRGATERLRTAITDTMLAAKKPMTPVELTQSLIEQGIPKIVGGDRLSNQVSRILRAFLADRKVDRKGNTPGSIFYTIKRPSIHVTKSPKG